MSSVSRHIFEKTLRPAVTYGLPSPWGEGFREWGIRHPELAEGSHSPCVISNPIGVRNLILPSSCPARTFLVTPKGGTRSGATK